MKNSRLHLRHHHLLLNYLVPPSRQYHHQIPLSFHLPSSPPQQGPKISAPNAELVKVA
jgi:hypothetical protein